MPLIRDGRFVPDDWVRLADEDAPPSVKSRLLVTWTCYQRNGEELAASGHEIGIGIGNDADQEALASAFDVVKLIAVPFPKSADGRGFSIATRLRRLGFQGELRASGHLIADQYALARSCGFDTVEISDGQAERQPEQHWIEAERSMSLAYQRGYGELRNILSSRWAAHGR